MQTSRTNFNFSGYLLSSVEILRSLSDDFEILVLYISFHSSLSLRWTSKRRVRSIILSLEVGLFEAVQSYA